MGWLRGKKLGSAINFVVLVFFIVVTIKLITLQLASTNVRSYENNMIFVEKVGRQEERIRPETVLISNNDNKFKYFSKEISRSGTENDLHLLYEKEMQRNSSLSYCPKRPHGLGPEEIDEKPLLMSEIEKKYPQVTLGGYYRPPNCTARFKIAILVPFRNRDEHLLIFLNHIHKFLMKQMLEYEIFVIEQRDNNPFNNGKLLNIGFVESKLGSTGFDCYLMHEVDALPIDSRILYTCPEGPRHFSRYHGYNSLWHESYGGARAFTEEEFNKINGFSNRFWGWNTEDDMRIGTYVFANMLTDSFNSSKINGNSSRETKSWFSPLKLKYIPNNRSEDGLNSLKYKLLEKTPYPLYTRIVVDLTTDETIESLGVALALTWKAKYENGSTRAV